MHVVKSLGQVDHKKGKEMHIEVNEILCNRPFYINSRVLYLSLVYKTNKHSRNEIKYYNRHNRFEN